MTPQDKHDPEHIQRSHRLRKQKRVNGLSPRWRLALMLLCAALALYGGIRLIAYAQSSRAARETNAALQALHEEVPASASPTSAATSEPSPVPTESATAAAPSPSPAVAPAMGAVFQSLGGELLPELKALYKRNRDLIGWLTIPGIVDLPVVYRDNTYYLTHDFNGSRAAGGTLFLDEYHPLTAQTQYLVIHGHNMTDGSMFGLLSHYRSLDPVRKNGIVTFSTLYRKEQYAIFAVLAVPEKVTEKGYLAYTGTPTFRTEAQCTDFLHEVRAGSLYRVPLEVDATDALLTLSTCLNDGRLILVCRRLRESETVGEVRLQLMQSVKQ